MAENRRINNCGLAEIESILAETGADAGQVIGLQFEPGWRAIELCV
jgi:hypothetical protein